MKELIAKGKFLFRFIHIIILLSMLLIVFIILTFYNLSLQLILIIIFIGLLDFILLYTSLPKKLNLNENGIYIKNPLISEEKHILWENIQFIEEKIYYRRDTFVKILMYIAFYGIFFLLFKEKYRCITITDNQFMRYQIYDYSYDEYDEIYEIIKTKCNNLRKNIIEDYFNHPNV